MFKKLTALLLVLLVLTFSLSFVSCGSGDKKTVKLAYVNWAEGIAMTNLAAAILEEMGYEVDMIMADVAPVFTSLAGGDSDVFLDVWLPVTHEENIKRHGADIVDLGAVYEGAIIGLVVPSYVTIGSIEELNANKDKFDGKIVGIDAGAGIMSAANRAIGSYGLDFTLQTSSGPVMTASLGSAIENEEWIVVTGWAPHWKFGKWDLKFLEDPKGEFGAAETIHKYSRKGFEDDMPEAAEFMKKFKMTDAELGSLMVAVEEGTNALEAARTWMNGNKALVDSWIK